MNAERKFFAGELKATNGGELEATFSRFNVLDRDGDVTLSSAIVDGTAVVLGHFNHGSVMGAALPIGKGVIRNNGTRAFIQAQLFDTASAREHYETIKQLGALANWSYAFIPPTEPEECSTNYRELEAYPAGTRRILKKLSIFEVSNVILASGFNTSTDAIKGSDLITLAPEFSELLERIAFARMAREVGDLRRGLLGFASDDFDQLHFS